jgi:hypothetical protein
MARARSPANRTLECPPRLHPENAETEIVPVPWFHECRQCARQAAQRGHGSQWRGRRQGDKRLHSCWREIGGWRGLSLARPGRAGECRTAKKPRFTGFTYARNDSKLNLQLQSPTFLVESCITPRAKNSVAMAWTSASIIASQRLISRSRRTRASAAIDSRSSRLNK